MAPRTTALDISVSFLVVSEGGGRGVVRPGVTRLHHADFVSGPPVDALIEVFRGAETADEKDGLWEFVSQLSKE
jgi:hypothetical protein